MKKVLFLLHLPPPLHGAGMIGSFLHDSELINNQYDAVFINISTSATLGGIGRVSFGKALRYCKTWCKFAAYHISNGRADLYYLTPATRGRGLFKELPLLFFVRLLQRPVVHHFHNKGLSEFLSSTPRFVRKLMRWVFSSTRTYCIVLSNRLRKDVKKYFNEKNIEVVPYGIPRISEQFVKTGRNGRRLLFLSNLIVSKGLLVFLDACTLLKDRGVLFEANIVGGEADLSRAELEQEIDCRGLSECCHYLGPRYGDDKYRVFSSSDIFVFPTFYPYETFGIVNLEAMGCGLPVISTDEGGIPDIVDEGVTGFIVPKQDTGALSDKLEYLLGNPDLVRLMGNAGRDKFIKEYTLDCFEQRMVNVFVGCIACDCAEST